MRLAARGPGRFVDRRRATGSCCRADRSGKYSHRPSGDHTGFQSVAASVVTSNRVRAVHRRSSTRRDSPLLNVVFPGIERHAPVRNPHARAATRAGRPRRRHTGAAARRPRRPPPTVQRRPGLVIRHSAASTELIGNGACRRGTTSAGIPRSGQPPDRLARPTHDEQPAAIALGSEHDELAIRGENAGDVSATR